MNLDPNSLERLRELGRKLPKEIKRPPTSKADKKKGKNLHPIEREEDPVLLFKELIKASPDGNIPPHLISRLKEVESSQQKNSRDLSIDKCNQGEQRSYLKKNMNKNNKNFNHNDDDDEQKQELYNEFNMLLSDKEDQF